MRKVTEVSLDVLTRPGRYRDVAPHLRVKEVYAGEGDGAAATWSATILTRRRGRRPSRARLLEVVRAETAALDVRQADHPKKACELMASRRFGRYLRMDARGRLSIDTTKVAAEAKYDGKFVVTTNDDTLDAADVALGYRSMTLIEGCFRWMKTTGAADPADLPLALASDFIAHAKLRVLALLLERAARSGVSRHGGLIVILLDQVKVVRYRMHAKTIEQQSGDCSIANILRSLGVPLPKRILEVSDEVHAPRLKP